MLFFFVFIVFAIVLPPVFEKTDNPYVIGGLFVFALLCILFAALLEAAVGGAMGSSSRVTLPDAIHCRFSDYVETLSPTKEQLSKFKWLSEKDIDRILNTCKWYRDRVADKSWTEKRSLKSLNDDIHDYYVDFKQDGKRKKDREYLIEVYKRRDK